MLFPVAAALAAASVAQAQTVTEAAPNTAAEAPNTQADTLFIVPGDGRQGTVKTVHGEVTLVNGQTRRAAVEGGGLRMGEQIITGADSSAALTLRDGTVVSIGPNSAVELSQYRFDSTTEDGSIMLSLLKGSLRVVTGLITHGKSDKKPAKVKVTTPTAVIGVRGTDVVIQAGS
jgi:hypothetical protein